MNPPQCGEEAITAAEVEPGSCPNHTADLKGRFGCHKPQEQARFRLYLDKLKVAGGSSHRRQADQTRS
jgi:hypothetical protein